MRAQPAPPERGGFTGDSFEVDPCPRRMSTVSKRQVKSTTHIGQRLTRPAGAWTRDAHKLTSSCDRQNRLPVAPHLLFTCLTESPVESRARKGNSMRPLGLATMLLAVALLTAPGSVEAQTGPGRAEAPVNPGWVFTPSLAVGGSWDDNVLLANAGDNPPRDYATPINPSIGLDYQGRRTRLSSGYEGSFTIYRTLSELNSSDHRLRLFVQHRPTRRLTLFAQESFARSPTTDALELAGIPFYRIGSRTNTGGGGFEATLAKHTALRGAYAIQTVRFEFDSRIRQELQGGHDHDILLSLGQALSPRLTLGGQYELRRAVVSGGLDRFNIHNGSMTLSYQPRPTLTVSGALGVARLGAALTHAERTGATVQAAVAHRGRRATVSASYQRSFIPSFGFGGTSQNEELGANVHVPFARGRAYAEGSVTWFDNEPLEPGVPTLRSLWVSATTGYRATRWLSLEAYYSGAQQHIQRPGGDLDRNQVGFRVVAVKPVRLR
jgi:hypothetical protein